MSKEFSRAELLLKTEGIERLSGAKVAVFGIGGVGSYAAEALARSGIKKFIIVDDDKVCITNINRQLIALRSTVGKQKTEVMKARILDISPKAEVEIKNVFYGKDTENEVDFSDCDYILDAIDTVSAKILLIEKAAQLNIPIISCMGAGNKLSATGFKVEDIYKTKVCPLARVLRKELKARGIPSLKVVYSEEEAMSPEETEGTSCKYNCVCPPGTIRKCTVRRQIPGSVSYVPPVVGLIAAGEIIKDIAQGRVGIKGFLAKGEVK